MWFGTQNGLNRYDGGSVVVFKNDPEDSMSIASGEIYSAFEDRQHNVWFGTNFGLSRYNSRINNFSNFDFEGPGQYAMRPVWSIIGGTAEHELWLGASGGLFLFNSDEHTFRHYVINDSIQHANSARVLCEDKRGNLWIGTFNGELLQFDKKTRKFRHAVAETENAKGGNEAITSIIEDGEGFVWIGSEDGTLKRYDDRNKSFVQFNKFSNQYPIIALMETSDNQLWIGTDKGGCYLLDRKSGNFIAVHDNFQRGTDVVLSLFNDRKGDVWIGTDHAGVFLFDKIDTVFNQFSPYPEVNNELGSNSVLSIYEDDQYLWIGTNGGGLVRVDGSSARYYTSGGPNDIAGNTIMCIVPGDDSKLYIGTYANGFSIFDKKTGRFSNYDHRHGLSDNSVYVIYPDGDKLWIGTNKGGLNLFDTKQHTFQHFANSLKDNSSISSNTIRSILKDSRNKLWIGTVSGLNLMNDDNTFVSFLHREGKSNVNNINILCIYEDAKKNIWLGTHGGGLNLYNYRTDTFTHFQDKHGLSGNIVYSMLEDAQGNLWLSTNKGISRFNPESVTFKNFDTGNGLTNAEFNVGARFKNKDGRMMFGNIEGVCSFLPHNIRENIFAPPIVLTDFLLFNKPVPLSPESPLSQSIWNTSEITLDYTQTVFTIRFAGLNYTHPIKNNYAYKLEPFDEDWNYIGSNRQATYTNLSAGTYLFKVKGSNNDGVWNEEGTSITIHILPPFWNTIWFRILLVGMLAAVVYLGYRIKLSSIRKQKEVLSNLVRERTLEIQDQSRLLVEKEKQNAMLIHQKLNDELTMKSRELTNYTLLIIQKNRLLDELKMKLKEVIRTPANSSLRDFRSLVQLINYSFSPEKEWSEFSVYFNHVHEGFIDTLKARYPDLTNYDLRLCTLYRIGSPAKDIAEAMGISLNSVKMARYRLRKKLSLPPDEDIYGFLQTIRSADQVVENELNKRPE
jgi:ligand-binding sensor domain-containing protein